jgi:serine/threonine protein kinase
MAVNMKLGKYTLLEELGRGGFGTVYKAEDAIGRTVAVKVLKPGWADDPGTIERFRREAQAAGELFHNRIATIIDFDQQDGRMFLVMRFINGLPLNQLIKKRRRIPWDQAVQIISEAAEGLDYAHQRGFVHRDIKPANIMVSPDEGAVVTDFGLVKAAEASGFTTTGVTVGTPNYIAPEVWEGKLAVPATDTYSLACVFFEMLTGNILFEGESPPQVMTKHVLEGPQFPLKWPKGVEDGIVEILERALTKDPAARYAKASDFVADLGKLSHAKEDQKALQKAMEFLDQARDMLSESSFDQALKFISDAEQLAPNLTEIQQLRREVERGKKLRRLYDQAVENFRTAREKAIAVLQLDPDYPDGDQIFNRLGLREETGKDVTLQPQKTTEDLSLRFREKIFPYLLILLGLATAVVFGIGAIGFIAGIGLIRYKDWARKTAVFYAVLLEIAGFVCTILYLSVAVNGFFEGIFISGIGIVAILISLYLFSILGNPRFLHRTGGTLKRPIGMWPILIGFLATGIGLIPLLILFIRDRTSRLIAYYFSWFWMWAFPIIGLILTILFVNGWGGGLASLFLGYLSFRAKNYLRSDEVCAFYDGN